MSPQVLATILLAFAPFFLSSNIILGAYAVRTVEPFTLTFIRWGLAFLIILPFAYKALNAHKALFLANWKRLLLLSVLGMWICGTGVYLALKYTSATNGTLIYTASPVLIIIIERLFFGRVISVRELIGVVLAMAGILTIIFKGSFEAMLSVQFNAGDLLFVLAASSWAVYSVLSKQKTFASVSTVGMFGATALLGSLIQVPFMIGEIAYFQTFPHELPQWSSLVGLALVSSVLAFLTYQYGIRILGAAPAGFVMYLLPPIGVVLAVVFLGETFHDFHLVGCIFVMAGVILATFPVRFLPGWLRGH